MSVDPKFPGFDLQARISSVELKNERLMRTLQEARTKIDELAGQLRALSRPPSSFATFIKATRDEAGEPTLVAMVGGRKMSLAVAKEVAWQDFQPGQQLLLNESLVVIGVRGYERTGDIVAVKLVLDEDRVLVKVHADDERVLHLAGSLKQTRVRVGDTLLADLHAGFALEHVERPDVEHLLLEEVPNVHYSDVGGLARQIDEIRDSVELPFEQPQLYREHGLKPPKGVLLYGPPGCGKTMIAKAVATELSARIGANRSVAARAEAEFANVGAGASAGFGATSGVTAVPSPSSTSSASARRAYFLNIKGPQLLDKYVGETERQIREIFARARDRAASGIPVVIFFDEMEALFRARGSGVSSDVETTVVPQLLAEIDGVEKLDNVIVIGASNREDMIDPAILRPGRLDVKIRIERPDRAGALDILAKYLTPKLPIHEKEIARYGSAQAAVVAMGEKVVAALFERSAENEYAQVTYADGEKETLYVADFVSGAMIAAIVDRAKKLAIKDFLATGERGITSEQLLAALREEARENEDLTNIANPNDWARVNGRGRGKRVTFVKPITHVKQASAADAGSAVSAWQSDTAGSAPAAGQLADAPSAAAPADSSVTDAGSSVTELNHAVTKGLI